MRHSSRCPALSRSSRRSRCPVSARSAYRRAFTKSISIGILSRRRQNVEVTPLTNRAFRSTRGLTGGLAFLLMGALAMVGLSACGAPAYTYVADSAAKAYYKVPTQWHEISQQDLNAALKAAGGLGAGIWSTAFDAGTAPSGSNFLAPTIAKPFVFAEVGTLSSTVSNEISYNVLRDFMLPVTSDSREQDAAR